MEFDKLTQNAIADAIRDGIKSKMSGGYNSPLDKLAEAAIKEHEQAIRKLLGESIASCLKDADFTESIKNAVRQALAKTLVQKFGGELEKQVNALKSDPTTRARIVLALEEIVSKNATA